MPGLSIRADSPVRDQSPSDGPNVDAPNINDTQRGPSRFSRSRSPRRSRHERGGSHSRRRRLRLKHKERNFLSAVCSMLVILMLCTALVEPDWIYVRGGGCSDGDGNAKHSIGVLQFFYPGHFEHVSSSGQSKLVYHFSAERSDVLVDCVTLGAVQVLQSIIALCFIGIVFSLMAFFLDLTGPTSRLMRFIRRNAVCNILTVVVCVTINGFSFLVTQLVEALQRENRVHLSSKIDIRFDVSFYLITAAGGLSVIGAASNLMRRYPSYDHSPSREQHEALLSDYEGMDIPLPQTPDYFSPINLLPPPPAYTP